MNFKLFADSTGAHEQWTGDASYRFNDSGLLEVNPGDGTLLTYSPHAWDHIEEQLDPSRAQMWVGR